MSEKRRILISGLVFFISLCGAIAFYYIIFKWSDFTALIKNFIRVINPIIIGFVLAYILIPVLDRIEESLLYPLFCSITKKDRESLKKEKGKIIRKASIGLTALLVVICLVSFFSILVPHLVRSIRTIAAQLPAYGDNLTNWVEGIFSANPVIFGNLFGYSQELDFGTFMVDRILPRLMAYFKVIPTELITRVTGFAKSVGNVILGLILSIYFMDGKERFMAQFKKILYALLPRDSANVFIKNLNFVHRTFIGFISGKILDSLIIGIICYVLVLILNMPYPELISVVVGVTNVIPYFGPFLGAIPCALLILMVNPTQCLYFVIMIIILQQFDGNVLGPWILGDSTGLSSFWVIFSIIVFGSLMGVGGLFIGVPVFAVIYAMVGTIINTKLIDKNLPFDNESYVNLQDISDNGIINKNAPPKEKKKNERRWTLLKRSRK